MGIFNEHSRIARVWDQRVAGPIQQHFTAARSPTPQQEKASPPLTTSTGQPQPTRAWYAPRRFSDKIAMQRKRQEDLEKILKSEVVAAAQDPTTVVPQIAQTDPGLSSHPAVQLQLQKERLAQEYAQETMYRQQQQQQQQMYHHQYVHMHPHPQQAPAAPYYAPIPPPAAAENEIQRQMSISSDAPVAPTAARQPQPCTYHAPYGPNTMAYPQPYTPCPSDRDRDSSPAQDAAMRSAPRFIPAIAEVSPTRGSRVEIIQSPPSSFDEGYGSWDRSREGSTTLSAPPSHSSTGSANNSFSIATLLSAGDSCNSSTSQMRPLVSNDGSTSGYATPGTIVSGHTTPYHDPARWRERGGSMRARRTSYPSAIRPDEAFISRRATSMKAVSRQHLSRPGHMVPTVPATIDYGTMHYSAPPPVSQMSG